MRSLFGHRHPIIGLFQFSVNFSILFCRHTFIALLTSVCARFVHFIILIFEVVSKNIHIFIENEDLVNIFNEQQSVCVRLFSSIVYWFNRFLFSLRWDNFIAIYWLTFSMAIIFIALNPTKIGHERRRNGICFWAFQLCSLCQVAFEMQNYWCFNRVFLWKLIMFIIQVFMTLFFLF